MPCRENRSLGFFSIFVLCLIQVLDPVYETLLTAPMLYFRMWN